MHQCLRLALVAALLVSAAGASPMLGKQDLFVAGEGGYHLYRIPGIVRAPKGTLIVTCEARQEPRWVAGDDWAAIDVLYRRSTDGGKTWSPPAKLCHAADDVELSPVALERNLCKPGDVTIHNAMGIADHVTGQLHFIYSVEYNRCFHMVSDDDGATFSDPVEITASLDGFRKYMDWRVIACGPGHGIQLKTGRLLVPVWMSPGLDGNGHLPQIASTIYSDDHGKTWQCGEIALQPPAVPNAGEGTLLELSDGRVMLNLRNDQPHPPRKKSVRAVVHSADGATGWSPVRFDHALAEPVCMGSLTRLPLGDGTSAVLFANPDNRRSSERKNVSVRLSHDEGESWSVSRVLEVGHSGYTDMVVDDAGMVCCFYERGSFGGRHLNTARLTLARFNAEWIMAGGKVLAPSVGSK